MLEICLQHWALVILYFIFTENKDCQNLKTLTLIPSVRNVCLDEFHVTYYGNNCVIDIAVKLTFQYYVLMHKLDDSCFILI